MSFEIKLAKTSLIKTLIMFFNRYGCPIFCFVRCFNYNDNSNYRNVYRRNILFKNEYKIYIQKKIIGCTGTKLLSRLKSNLRFKINRLNNN